MEEGPQLSAIHNRIVEIWDKEINPRWKIIDDYDMKGIVPEKLKSITLGKLFSELNNIPTKISRIRRLLKSEKEKERIKDYELQMSVHEKELEERQQLLQQISNMPVDMIKMIII